MPGIERLAKVAKILRSLQLSCTVAEAASSAGVHKAYAARLIGALAREGCAKRVRTVLRHGIEAVVWKLGESPCVQPGIGNIPELHERLAKFVWALLKPSHTPKQLVQFSGLSAGTVYDLLKYLNEEGCIYVAHWERERLGPNQPVYALGRNRAGAACPGMQSSNARWQKRKAKKLALQDPFMYAFFGRAMATEAVSVYRGGKNIETVWCAKMATTRETLVEAYNSLVNHDGYSPEIEVRLRTLRVNANNRKD